MIVLFLLFVNINLKYCLLEAVGSEFKDEPDMNIEGVVRGVFALLSGKISSGEIEDIRAILPGDMKDLLA